MRVAPHDPGMTAEQIAVAFRVSRETAGRLAAFVALLERWNRRINLVSPASLANVWTRHVADSLQLLDLAPPEAMSWIDLGSGGGFPAMPVAIVAAETRHALHFTLVESDARKAAFLSAAGRELGLSITVEPRRIESLPPLPYDVVSARALAPLPRLLTLAVRFTGPSTVFLFPKGAGLDSELTSAEAAWHIRAERIASRTEPGAAVLRIRELRPHR